MTQQTPDFSVSAAHIEQWTAQLAGDARHRLAVNAVTSRGLNEATLNRDVVKRSNHVYSHWLKSNPATSQKQTGRCWLFAGLNLFRVEAIKRLEVEDFEFSQAHLMFWDKLEKANFFLESIIATAGEPLDGRLVQHLLVSPIQDGGQWDMFANLIQKYGVVPKSVMPESFSSSHSVVMNNRITARLREDAATLRMRAAGGASRAALADEKLAMLAEIHRMLVVHLGEPPRSFEWQWRDKTDTFHRAGVLTPQDFFKRYVDYPLDALVCLVHDPMPDRPTNTVLTVDYLGNVIEGAPIRYLNVDLPVFKQAALDMLVKQQEPVWFGCDVGKGQSRDVGVLDLDVFDAALAYGFTERATKGERLSYGQSQMTHAMVLTGVDLDAARTPRKWRVENSWGNDYGDKGYFAMTDRWMDEYCYEVLVRKEVLPADLMAALDMPARHLPPWDPMGALAISV